ncbi:hypothetical protein [Micromonospora fulviviridis]|uniref:Uncharacterized protein n=1 Tax=Micromonospora fulviviridis TaxID=47860 RepID=A0ABV2VT00_9ACTN
MIGRVLDDLDLAVKHDNCWYAVDSNLEAPWCDFDSELAAKQTPRACWPESAGLCCCSVGAVT